MNPENAQPVGETYSYKGWLNSDSFIKRALGVLGYSFVGSLILYIPFIALFAFLISGALFSGMKNGSFDMDNNQPKYEQVEEAPVGMKLDINQICDDSLAFTTFTDGAASDAYLVDCKAGKHPEVIEQFKQSLQMEDGTTL
ncbi:MAG: hypothetical protein WAX38_03375 [Minisyncoccia bacterium]